MNHKLGDVAFAIVIVAMILVATRPGSQRPKFISAVGGAFASAVRAATGTSGGKPAAKPGGKKPRVNR